MSPPLNILPDSRPLNNCCPVPRGRRPLRAVRSRRMRKRSLAFWSGRLLQFVCAEPHSSFTLPPSSFVSEPERLAENSRGQAQRRPRVSEPKNRFDPEGSRINPPWNSRPFGIGTSSVSATRDATSTIPTDPRERPYCAASSPALCASPAFPRPCVSCRTRCSELWSADSRNRQEDRPA